MDYANIQICKSCKKEIPTGATKCSYCQTCQIWYRNPNIFNFIFLILGLFYVLWQIGNIGIKEFNEFKSDFKITEIKVIDSNFSNSKLVTYKIENNTKYKWDEISYEVVSRYNGELLASQSGMEYFWVIQPNSESLLTVDVKNVRNANEWQLTIKNLKSDRY